MASSANQPNREELFMLAENAAKQGQKDSARVMFHQVWEQNKRNERAMMWLAKLAPDQKERKIWLSRILKVNPNNEGAKSALAKIQYKHAAEENRTLVLFGAVAGVLVVVGVIILVVVLTAHH